MGVIDRRLAWTATVALLLACPVVGGAASQEQERPRPSAESQPAVVGQAAVSPCTSGSGIIVYQFHESNEHLLGQWQQIHGGDFRLSAAVERSDPRFTLSVDTSWVAATWSSPSGILWGRDYAPNEVFEGITRLLDNRGAAGRLGPRYALSFASLTPRLVLHRLCAASGQCWYGWSADGLIAMTPYDENRRVYGSRGFCGNGLFFLDKAFDENGRIPEPYWYGLLP